MGFSAFFFYLANQLFIGGPVILMSENHEADFLIAAINKWDDTVTLVTPALARQFLSKAPAEGVLFPKMRALCIGAAPLYAAEKRQILAKLSPNFYEVYGNAACGFISSLHPDEVLDMAESVGRPAPNVTLEVVNAEGKVVPAGTTGHLRVRGPGISEKFTGPEDTAAKGAEGFRDGWYYPGDLGSLGPNGQIFLSGRNADIVRRAGVEILPSEIEEVFLAHSSIADAAAVVGPTNEKGDQLVVFVVPKGEPNTRELSTYSRGKIPAEKFPDKVYFVRELPKNANGKVDKAKLKVAALRGLAPGKPADAAEEKVG
jgi:acyl-CoA synthetase (AMP-forming)/AMP-acid ligase II